MFLVNKCIDQLYVQLKSTWVRIKWNRNLSSFGILLCILFNLPLFLSFFHRLCNRCHLQIIFLLLNISLVIIPYSRLCLKFKIFGKIEFKFCKINKIHLLSLSTSISDLYIKNLSDFPVSWFLEPWHFRLTFPADVFLEIMYTILFQSICAFFFFFLCCA